MKNTASTKSTTTRQLKSPSKKTMSGSVKNIVNAISTEQRTAMIADAAYYIAEKYGFNPELSEFCWLEAEKEIDAELLRR
jgi:hypothetical protein